MATSNISPKNDLNLNEINYNVEVYIGMSDKECDALSETEATINNVASINVKQEFVNTNATEDESMAVEALRQLGGMYENVVVTNTELPLLGCEMCAEQFSTVADLQSHTIVCNGWENALFKCKICVATFQRKSDLQNHLVCHQSDRPHACRSCGNLFVDKDGLDNHMRSQHDLPVLYVPNRCQVCGQSFQRLSSLTNHMKIHTYQPGRAMHLVDIKPSLNKTGAISDTFILDTNINPNWNVPYEFNNSDNECGLIDEEEVNDKIHIEFSPLKEDEDVGEVLKTKLWASREEVISTTTIMENGVYTSGSKPQIDVEVGDSKKQHSCKYCGVCFHRAKALKSHLRVHTDSWDLNECTNCKDTFETEKQLRMHTQVCKIFTVRSVIPDECESSSSNITDNYIPATIQDVSTRAVINNDKVALPPIIHSLVTKKYPCSECGKRFGTKQKMVRHLLIHRKKTFCCEVCSAMFKEQSALDEHRLFQHPSNSGYICEQCGKSFVSRQGLWEHTRVHDGSKIGLFRCSDCGKSFSSRQGYLIHKRTHTGEKPYGCRFCMKAFRDGSTLRKHERIHTGERPHVCPLCFKAFTQKVVLRDHVRWVHVAVTAPNEESLFECSLCEHCVPDKDELCVHIVKHSDKKNGSKLIIENNSLPVTNQSEQSAAAAVAAATAVVQVALGSITNVTSIGENNKNLKCDICTDTFAFKNDLLEHIRIHI